METEWHAVEALNKALGKTHELLLKKFNLSFWLKLALITFLLSGGLNLNLPGSFSDSDKNPDIDFSRYLPLIVMAIAVLLIIGMVFAFIGAVAQFMFIDALVDSGVELIKGFKKNMALGFNLFLFNLGLGILAFIVVLITFIPAMLLLFKGAQGASIIVLILAIIAAVIVFICFVIVLNLVGVLNNDFAIVILRQEKRGMLNAWRRLISLIKRDVKQVIVYLVLKIALAIMAGVIGFVVFIVLFIAYLIAMFVLGLFLGIIAYATGFSLESLAIWAIILVIAVIGFILMSYVYAVILLPFYVFFRYYSLHFLQRMEPAIRLMEDEKPADESKGEETEEATEKSKGRKRKNEKKLKVY